MYFVDKLAFCLPSTEQSNPGDQSLYVPTYLGMENRIPRSARSGQQVDLENCRLIIPGEINASSQETHGFLAPKQKSQPRVGKCVRTVPLGMSRCHRDPAKSPSRARRNRVLERELVPDGYIGTCQQKPGTLPNLGTYLG